MKYLILFALIFSPIQFFAQTTSSAFDETVSIEIIPKIPAPKELVNAEVKSSYYASLKKANVSWVVDGVVKKSGVGETFFQFQAPASGKNSNISVSVTKENGLVLRDSISLAPSDIDLVYEADTYVPPFYRGRSLFTHQSAVTVAAMTTFIENGVRLPKEKITYTWAKDDEIIQSASGVGRDSIKIQGALISRPFYVSVVAESINSNLTAKKRILINPTTPQVVLYENNPIYGSIFEKALTGTFNFDREEVGITAVPYFFSAQERSSGNLQYRWFENGRRVGDDSVGSFINYLNPGKEKNGTANLAVQVEHIQNILQEGGNLFKINVLGNQQFDTIKPNETTAF